MNRRIEFYWYASADWLAFYEKANCIARTHCYPKFSNIRLKNTHNKPKDFVSRSQISVISIPFREQMHGLLAEGAQKFLIQQKVYKDQAAQIKKKTTFQIATLATSTLTTSTLAESYNHNSSQLTLWCAISQWITLPVVRCEAIGVRKRLNMTFFCPFLG